MKKKKSRIVIHLKCNECLNKLSNNKLSKSNKFNTKKNSFFYRFDQKKIRNLKKRNSFFKLSTYTTTKNRFNTLSRLNLKKYCFMCKTHTIHKEIK